MKLYHVALILLLGKVLIGCQSRQPAGTTGTARSTSNCEIANVTGTRSAWEFNDTVNAMDGRHTAVASLDAPGKHASLIIRCRNTTLPSDLLCNGGGKLDAYVVTDDIVHQYPTVRVRFDDGRPVSENWNRSGDYKAMFAPNPHQLVSALMKSKQFFIEYPPYERIPETINFSVKGLPGLIDAAAMDSFLRGLTRQDVVAACGPGVEETPNTVSIALSYPPTKSAGIGLKFEFSTYGDDTGKLTSIDTIGFGEENRLLWYVHSSSRGFAQQTALALVNSSPGLSTLWKTRQQDAAKEHTITPARPSTQ